MKWGWGRVAGSVAILAAILLPNATARAAGTATSQSLSARFTLNVITLDPGGQATTDLVVTNPNDVDAYVSDVTITSAAHLRVVAPPTTKTVDRIRSHATKVLTVRISADSGFDHGQLAIMITAHTSGGRLLSPSIATLTAQTNAPPAAVTVAFDVPDALHDGQTRGGVIRIVNTRFDQIELSAVNSDDVAVTMRCPDGSTGCSVSGNGSISFTGIEAGVAITVPVTLHVDSEVRPGAQSVTVIASARNASAHAQVVVTEASASIAVSVWGIDVLSPFGITVLFLLPGIVGIVIFVSLRRAVYPQTKTADFAASFSDPRSMVSVVPLSALAYILLWWLVGHDLRNQASTQDVELLFGLGVAIGGLAWGILAAGYYQRVDRKTFRTSDSPKRVVQRLKWRGSSVNLPAVIDGKHVFYELAHVDADVYFVAGPIRITFTTEKSSVNETDWQRAVASNNLGELVRIAKRRGVLLRFDPSATVRQLAIASDKETTTEPIVATTQAP